MKLAHLFLALVFALSSVQGLAETATSAPVEQFGMRLDLYQKALKEFMHDCESSSSQDCISRAKLLQSMKAQLATEQARVAKLPEGQSLDCNRSKTDDLKKISSQSNQAALCGNAQPDSLLSASCLAGFACAGARQAAEVIPKFAWETALKLSNTENSSLGACLKSNKPTCLDGLAVGFLKGLWGNLKDTWGLIKSAGGAVWTGAKWVWRKLSQVEDESSQKMLAAAQFSDAEVEHASHGLIDRVTNGFSEFAKILSDFAQENFSCSEWSGQPYISSCNKKSSSFACADCEQKTQMICGMVGAIGGYLAAEIIPAFFTGGAAAAAKALAKGGAAALAKAGDKLAVKLALDVPAIAGKLDPVLAIAASARNLGVAKLTSAFDALKNSGAAQRAAELAALAPVKATIAIVAKPVQAYGSLLEDATKAGFKTVDAAFRPVGRSVSGVNGLGAFNGKIASIDNKTGIAQVDVTSGPLAGHQVPVDVKTLGAKVDNGYLKVGEVYSVAGNSAEQGVLKSINGRIAELIVGGKRIRVPIEDLRHVNITKISETVRKGTPTQSTLATHLQRGYDSLGTGAERGSVVTDKLLEVDAKTYSKVVSEVFNSSDKNTLVLGDFHLGGGAKQSSENLDRAVSWLHNNSHGFSEGKVILTGDLFDQKQLSKWLQETCGHTAISGCSPEELTKFHELVAQRQGDLIQKIKDAGHLRNDQLVVQGGNHDFARVDKVNGYAIYSPESLRATEEALKKRFPGIQIHIDPDGTNTFTTANGKPGTISHYQAPPPGVDLPTAFKGEGHEVTNVGGALAGQPFVGETRQRISADNHVFAAYHGDYDGAPRTYLSAPNLGGVGLQFRDPVTGELHRNGLFTILLEDGRPVTFGPCGQKTCPYSQRAFRAEDFDRLKQFETRAATPAEIQEAHRLATLAKENRADELVVGLSKDVQGLPQEVKNKLHRLILQSDTLQSGKEASVVDQKIAKGIIETLPGFKNLTESERAAVAKGLLGGCK